MTDINVLIASERHHEISDRIARASTPRLPTVAPRHRMAERLRRFADRLDG
ncbi:MAG: hypothetical protein ACXVWZ_11180 [Nocardioides sp.]